MPAAKHFDAVREHHPDPEPSSASWSGFKIFLFTLMGILGTVAIVVVGIIVYQNHQQNSRKRFY